MQPARTPAAALCLALAASLTACDQGEDRYYEEEPVPVEPEATGRPPVEELTGTEVTAEVPDQIVSTLINRTGDKVGSVIIHPTRHGVRVDLHAEGLTPGNHAVHFHENGECQPPDFMSAGGHYDPAGAEHGRSDADEDMDDPDHHAGDLLNQTVNDTGQMDVQITPQSVTIEGPENPLLDENGSALVIHALPDYDPGGGSAGTGERVACAELIAIN